MKNEPIITVQTFQVSAEIVWNAITQLDEMRQWYFENIPNFEAKVGFKTQFIVKTKERVFLHNWNVTEVIPLQKISYQWTFNGYKGISCTHWELIDHGNVTTLKLTSEVLEDHPDNIPEFKRESGVGGWNYFIKERLFKYLEAANN